MRALILSIETATTVCSVGVSYNNEIIAVKELNNGFSHAENLHVFIKTILEENKLSINELSAVALSKGPGSYTGLRIGASAAKGLCYALNIPLIAINTLQSMALMAIDLTQNAQAHYCPMLDARRMEVYCATYNNLLEEVRPTEAKIIDASSVHDLVQNEPTYFFGEGMLKCRELLGQNQHTQFLDNIYPSASYTLKLAYEDYCKKHFENTAYFEPYYLKEFYSKLQQ